MLQHYEPRPDREDYFMSMALLVSFRSTCISRRVGCVLVNGEGHVLSTGYNGAPSGMAHCTTTGICQRKESPSGQGLENCVAIHAEQNALLQCRDVREIGACYVTSSPCSHCLKLLMNTACSDIFYAEPYPNEEAVRPSIDKWILSREGRYMVQLPSPKLSIDWEG